MKLMRWIKPADGVVLTDPETGVTLPPEGGEVEWSSWWQRRQNDGDVSEIKTGGRKGAQPKGGDE